MKKVLFNRHMTLDIWICSQLNELKVIVVEFIDTKIHIAQTTATVELRSTKKLS